MLASDLASRHLMSEAEGKVEAALFDFLPFRAKICNPT